MVGASKTSGNRVSGVNDLRTAFSAPRMTRARFPSYRFLPGIDPHPTANPNGHSFRSPGTAPVLVTYVPPDQWIRSMDYLYGCDLYNHAYWWEAHEAWEGLWQLTDKRGTQGRFLQGLIQIAACHLQLYMGHPDGVARLLSSAMRYLAPAIAQVSRGTYMGVPVADFSARVTAYFAPDSEGIPARLNHEASEYPFIPPAVPVHFHES